MSLENRIQEDNKVQKVNVNRIKNNHPWGQYALGCAVRIGVGVAILSFVFGLKNAKANESDYLPSNFNRAKVVDTRAIANQADYSPANFNQNAVATSSLSSTEPVKANDYSPADFNQDRVVDIEDMIDFANQWLANIEGREIIHVYECGCLDQEGAKYVLKNDITTSGNCFTISANDISFDLGEFTITGDYDGLSSGVRVNGYDSITISGGSISDFSKGILIFCRNSTGFNP